MRHLIRQALRFFARTLHGVFIHIPFHYARTMLFLLRKRGPKAVYNFIFVKLFARGERVGLQLLDPVEMNFPQLTPYPYMIEMEITTRCHLRCTICEHTYWPDPDYKTKDLTFDQFKHILDQIPNLKYINLTGEGSSFANKDFIRILELCNQRNIYATVIDSFTAIREEELDALVRLGAGKLVLSLDASTAETYDKVRVGGKFEKVMENIGRFAELRAKYRSPLPEFCFRFIFFKDNYRDLILYPDLVNSHRITKFRDGEDNHVELTGLLEFDAIRGWQVELEKEFIDNVEKKLVEYKLPHAWSHPSCDPGKMRPVRECVAWAEPYIMMGGYALPCCAVMMSNRRAFLMKHAFGNVYEKSFREIWNSKRYREFRKLVPRSNGPVPIMCAGCRVFNTSDRQKKYGISDSI